MSVFRHKVASYEKLRLAFVKLRQEQPQKYWSPPPCYSSDDEDDGFNVRGAESALGEQGGPLFRGSLWNSSRYNRQIESAAKYLNAQTGGNDNVLVVNLGPTAPVDCLLRALFDNHVVELPEAFHEQPPGSGIFPLDVLFTLCSCMKSWLDLSKNHVVLLHVRSSAGTGMDTLKFVTYCFLAFNGDTEESDINIATLSKPGWRDSSSQGGRPSLAGVSGPSQQRYSRYFLHILLAPAPPQKTTALVIKKVSFDGINSLRRARNMKVLEHLLFHTPFLMIYQRGQEKWKGQCVERGSNIEFQVDLPVAGDMVIGLWFIKDIKKQGDPPMVAFAFHASFVGAGEFVFSSSRLDLNKASVAGDLTMKILFEESEVPVEDVLDLSTRGTDIQEMRKSWEEQKSLSAKAFSARSVMQQLDPGAEFTESQQVRTEDQATPREMEMSVYARPSSPSKEQQLPEPIAVPTTSRTTMDIGVGCSFDMDEGKFKMCYDAPVSPKNDEEEAPSTPSTAETSLIRMGSTDLDNIAGPGPSSEVAVVAAGAKVSPPAPPPCKRRAPPPPPPPPPPGKLRGAKAPHPPPAHHKLVAGRGMTRMRSFYWTKTPKQSGTVWGEFAEADALPEPMNDMLEDLFGADDGSKKGPSDGLPEPDPPEAPKQKVVQLVSTGRATNVSIMMSRFKSFEGGVEGLCNAVLTGEGLSVEELRLLSQIAPREEEVKAFKEYGGSGMDLSEAEQILMQMCKVTRLRRKASCWAMMDNWETNYKKATNMLHVTKLACQQIRESKRLRAVLGAVLTVGNSMNRGTHRGNAGGCRVESLLRLVDTKVSGYSMQGARQPSPLPFQRGMPRALTPTGSLEDEITSLLDFVVFVVHEGMTDRDYSPVSFLSSDLELLAEADAFMDGSVGELLEEIREGFDVIESEVMAMVGSRWSVVDKMSWEEVQVCTIRGKGPFLKQERGFALILFDFLKRIDEDRGNLRREHSVAEQFLKSASIWLGEPESSNPRRALRDLLEFVKLFDAAYDRLSKHLSWD
ncbi:hypothetical protein BSKO_00956 [Bryopsis sp. KO-2023]|nr:hypothetical protein BSKO_00956 [Bryopsis sp. KO-2023]